ncbi:hypothetical protein GCM10011611_17310 [Aliidongia dinghuensis]|uniref:DUF4239 domain-containing protein n=1 Tax=Aliidongia dinghuensis TaxID=1867774 RepID=A0A8J2YSZ5_9PROT|nr:hypothetical protein [Aliidongia dinghuensis]GGF12220.1 hypothetical protein GCM10011611_17310 [Aliidongia dinghuensis]
METELLYGVGQAWIYGASLLALAGALELGRWIGRRRRAHAAGDHSALDTPALGTPALGTIESASLGLLALMIGFTFSMALTRYDTRKAAVLDEANAIGTAALRAEMLPEAQARASADLLTRYAEARLALGQAGYETPAWREAIARSLELQAALWREAVAASAADPRSTPIGLYVQALNDVIDMHEKRLTALRNHVPETVVLLLYLIAVIATGFTGYGAGLSGDGERGSKLLMALLIATVLILVIDLDRPYRGLITVSQLPMRDLIQGLPTSRP